MHAVGLLLVTLNPQPVDGKWLGLVSTFSFQQLQVVVSAPVRPVPGQE